MIREDSQHPSILITRSKDWSCIASKDPAGLQPPELRYECCQQFACCLCCTSGSRDPAPWATDPPLELNLDISLTSLLEVPGRLSIVTRTSSLLCPSCLCMGRYTSASGLDVHEQLYRIHASSTPQGDRHALKHDGGMQKSQGTKAIGCMRSTPFVKD